MNVPECILEKQTCSTCHQYLSVGPVKVYNNREVKCGRCCTNDDLGVPSRLFNMVTKNMKFPCVNRYDGCTHTHFSREMENHEALCFSGNYECYLCTKFQGSGYNLNSHCRTHHRKQILENQEFCVDFDRGSHDKMYYYCRDVQMFFVRFDWNMDAQDLTLEVIHVGQLFEGNMSYSFRIYSLEDQLLYKSKQSPCSILDVKGGHSRTVHVDQLRKVKNIVICRFLVHQEPRLYYQQELPLIDDSLDTCLLRCSFKNPTDTPPGECEIVHPAVYYFKDIAWRVLIKRKRSYTDYTPNFKVYLRWMTREGEENDHCHVTATFSVLTPDFKKRISKGYVNKQFFPGANQGVTLHNWYHIVGENESGFMRNNCLIVEVKMKIYLPSIKTVKCHACGKKCLYCNNG